jgi:hypothetical protein
VRMSPTSQLVSLPSQPQEDPRKPLVQVSSTLSADFTCQYENHLRRDVLSWLGGIGRIKNPFFSKKPTLPCSGRKRILLGGVTNCVSSPNDQGHHRPSFNS